MISSDPTRERAKQLFLALRDTLRTDKLPSDWDKNWDQLALAQQKVFLEAAEILYERANQHY